MKILSDLKDRCTENLVPMQVTFELTYRCNERCGHCYLATYDDKADGRPSLSLDEWKSAIDQLAEAGSLILVLIGGEAMMHPDFWSIAEYAASRSFALTLITNGLLIDEKAADQIADLGFYQVTFSVYSLDAAIHDAMTRRKGSHARVMTAIERLRRRGVGIGINCLLTSMNIDGCFELEAWAKAHQIRISFDPLVTAKSDGSLSSTATRASREQLLRFYRALQESGRGVAPSDPLQPEDPACNAGRGKCAVNAYGDLLTCLEVREPIGNLREASFRELWRSPQAEKLRGLKNKDLQLGNSCGDSDFCDHCPGMARAEAGDPAKPVPFLMELASIKRQVYQEARNASSALNSTSPGGSSLSERPSQPRAT